MDRFGIARATRAVQRMLDRGAKRRAQSDAMMDGLRVVGLVDDADPEAKRDTMRRFLKRLDDGVVGGGP